jgi:hypothetical protein
MGERFRDYLRECISEVPMAYRRGIIAVTILANAAVIAALYLGWHLNAFTAFQIITAGVVLAALEVIVIFPFRRWKFHKDEIARLTSQINPKLKCSFHMSDPGCVRPNTPIYKGSPEAIMFTWYRLRVDASGSEPITNCSGRLLSVKRGEAELLLGETPKFPFAPHEEPDALSKTIYPGVPVYLDLLSANAKHGIAPAFRGALSPAVKWNELFRYAGDYALRIGIVSANSPTATIDIKFKWTLDPATSSFTAMA